MKKRILIALSVIAIVMTMFGVTACGGKSEAFLTPATSASVKIDEENKTMTVEAGVTSSIPQAAVTDKDGNVYTAEFDLAQFEAEQPGGYYTYYEAESGKLYLIVKVSTTNLKGNDLKYDAIAGVSCVYNEKYNYSAFCVLEKDGGTNLNGYPSQYAISPLDSGVCYYLMEVPEVVQQGPVVITVYVGGQYYTLKV